VRVVLKCVSTTVLAIGFKDTGKEIIILLCGGDKSTQQEDIAKAKKIAVHYNPDEKEE
jgi:putative addiction module killer protein